MEAYQFLQIEGSENMTEKFSQVILAGFITSLIFVVHQVRKQKRLVSVFSESRAYQRAVNPPNRVMRNFIMDVLVNLAWISQFLWLIATRFSHAGQVCSGDYSDFYLFAKEDDVLIYEQGGIYEEFYSRKEGAFMYYFVIVSLSLTLCLLTIILSYGAFMFKVSGFLSIAVIFSSLTQI
mmetsp:Transcript_2825/g.4828  ORF Transcript_2825/g.4828 Transcript_2825/m.4828 type:complete len:179 (+) Transcript_2825:131-667(+)